MILCPVCGKGNGDLSVRCVECRGYLQSKVDALDLFTIAWTVIENPVHAFRKIALATHKNYIVLLASLFGIAWCYTAFWATNAARWLPDLFVIILAGVLAGPLVGIFSLLALSPVAIWVGRRLGGGATFRNMFALTSYSTLPVVLSLIFVFPVDIGIFGIALFGSPPTPWELKPGIFGTLLAVHGAALLWSFGLLVLSSSVAHGISRWKASLVAFVIACTLCAVIFSPFLLWS